ncbi:MAG: phosphotyrosine protein phosphatase [Thaumarchaeota archaeon]|nr:phosphotyrosine protein phosphatase [Nitrososphaerota archaeon]
MSAKRFNNTKKRIKAMRVLFICNQNLNRSKRAEQLFSETFETRSAGLYNEKPVTEKQMQWADIVVVMEEHQREELAMRFPKQYLKKRIVSLGIHDIYYYEQEELAEELKAKVAKLLRGLNNPLKYIKPLKEGL